MVNPDCTHDGCRSRANGKCVEGMDPVLVIPTGTLVPNEEVEGFYPPIL